MDSYSMLLERIRLPQPSMQRHAVVSIFEKLRSASPILDADSNPGRDAISQCLQSNSTSVVDQSVRELCRLVREGKIDYSRGLLELQSALEGCDSRFVDVFVKGIGFLVRHAFQKNDSLCFFDASETHPFVKVLCCRIEVQSELTQQVLLFILQNKSTGVSQVCNFLRPFLNFLILRMPFSASSSLFARHLLSSIASLCCSFPSEAMPFIKLLMGCLQYLPRKSAEDCKEIFCFAESLVEAFIVVLRQTVGSGLPTSEAQLYGVEILEVLLSLCTDLDRHTGGKEPIVELSKSLLVVQKELGLQYLPEFFSVTTSLFVILTRAEFEHEQLCILKLSVFLLKWKSESEYVMGRTACGLSEELLFILPVINLLSSPSRSIKAAATDLLSELEKILMDLLVSQKKVSVIQEESPSGSKPQSMICRTLRHLWFQEHHSLCRSSFLSFASNGKAEIKSWMSHIREYCLMIVERKKSHLMLHENLLTEMPLLFSSVVAVLVMHDSLGTYAVDSLAAIGVMDPKVGLPLLLAILFYNKIFCNKEGGSHEILIKLLEMLPSLASHSAMIPLVVQTILPMLHRKAKPMLHATATRLLCKTWEVTDRVFGSLQGILHPKAFNEFGYEKDICISMAASIRDVCRKNPDRGVDLILSVSACIESRDPTVQSLGFQSLGYLCEADVVDFYTAWNIIANHVLDYSVDPIVAHGICILLRWGAMDAEAYPEASKSVLEILWEVGASRHSGQGHKWVKARSSAFESMTAYEVEHIQKSIPDFKKRNIELLISEVHPNVIRAMEGFEVKIITFEHTTRRRLLKEKKITVNKVEKLLDVFPRVIFPSGSSSSNARHLPGAALLCLSFSSKKVHGQGTSQELAKLRAAYENSLVEIAESLPLSRNVFVALLSLQSWKPFMQRWMREIIVLLDAKVQSNLLDKTLKAADDILKSMWKIAEESIPRSAENIALATGALCMILPSSAHTVTTTASEFLLKWLFQFEHEHRQWSAAIALGLVSSCLHATDHRQRFQIITGLLKVTCNSKSTLVKGACGVGLGFACRDLLTRVEVIDDSQLEETNRVREAKLLGKVVRALSLMICQLSPSSFGPLQSLCKYFPSDTDDMGRDATSDFPCNNENNLEEDVWGVAGLVMGLVNSVSAIHRAGGHSAVITIKALLKSWIPHVNPIGRDSCVSNVKPEIILSVGSCLALPTVVAFCQRVELIDDDELNHLVNGYRELISELVSVKKSGTFHQSLLMASCIGAGSLLSCILDEGVHTVKTEDVKGLLELFRKSYSNPYPPTVHFGGMLGVVNALGAGAGTLSHCHTKPPSLQTGYGHKESSYIRGPILSNSACETLPTSLMQEMFLVAQDSKDPELQKYAAWAVSFLRHRWWSKDLETVKNSSQSDSIDSQPVSQNFPEDSVVWQLCLWLMDLKCTEEGAITHVNTVAAVLRCLLQAPRLPSLDWGAIIRRCMRYEDQVSGKLSPVQDLKKGALREDCIRFALAHGSHINPLLVFLDELSDLSRFRTLELKIKTCLLCHLVDLIKIFSDSRLEKLFDDIADYLSSSASSYQVYNPDQKSLLRVSLWKGLYCCLDEVSSTSPKYIRNMEKCMNILFALLPALHLDASLRKDQENFIKEWSEAVRCLGKARQDWLMDLLEVPEIGLVQGGHFTEVLKRIQARARLVINGCIPYSELVKSKVYILNMKSDDVWYVLEEVVAALQCAEGAIKRQWLVDAVEISCGTKYPTTALQFVGLLSSGCSKYMPLLIMDPVAVLSDLPITLPSLLSDKNWMVIAESIVLNLWRSTERVYDWATHLDSGDDFRGSQSIDRSESNMAVFLARVMHQTCVSLKDYLPLEKQLKLANMVVP